MTKPISLLQVTDSDEKQVVAKKNHLKIKFLNEYQQKLKL